MEARELEERKKKLFGKIKNIFSEKTQDSAGSSEILEARKKKFIESLLSKESNWLYFLFLIPVLWLTWFVRTRNLAILQGKYLLGLDAYFFFRYTRTIIEQGALPIIDFMRYSPMGYPTQIYQFFPKTLVWFYKVANVFAPNLTLMEWHIIYPPVVTVISVIFFFLFVRELFGNKVALVSSAFLAVIPGYLYRTGAGFADHEAMAMLFVFISVYFFVLMWKYKNVKMSVLFGVLAGIVISMAGATWGGFRFVTMTIGLFMVVSVLLKKINKRRLIGTFSFFITYALLFGYLNRGKLFFDFIQIDSAMLVFGLLVCTMYLLITKYNFKILDKIKDKINLPIIAIMISIAIVAIPSFLFKIISWDIIYNELTSASATRFGTTISESMQPFFTGSGGWWSSFGWVFYLFFFGSMFLCYKMFESPKKGALFTALYGAVLSFFIIGRYEPSNETIIKFFSNTYLYWFFGFIIILIGAYLYYHYKGEKLFSSDWRIFFIFIWFLLAVLMARTQLRLLFSVVPVAAIVGGFFIVKFSEEIYKKHNIAKLFVAILIIFSIYAFATSAQITMATNQGSGSGFPGQWENSMTWIRENTQEAAVIGHWWDYGHWTTAMGERAAVGDGGNNMGWNHGLGRYIMTSNDLTKTLEYAKTHKITHILYSKEEIGKYHAFSLIGSDENLDRRSTIGVFILQGQSEVRGGDKVVYGGTWPLDKDYVVGNLVLPEGHAAIIGFSFLFDENKIKEPKTYVAYNGQQIEMGINCIVSEGKKIEFEKGDGQLNGCLVLVPYIQEQQSTPIGGAYWASEKVRDGLFARLYLYNEDIEYFDEVYDDGLPLSIYQGSIMGPIKIWEINYPDDVKTNEKYLESSAYG